MRNKLDVRRCPGRLPMEGRIEMRQICLIYLVIAWFFASVAVAEYLVNTQTTYNQTDPAVAMDLAGNFVVVWSSYRQDGDSGGVFGQRFDNNCRQIGGEFQINEETIGNQTDPDVAMHKTGGFVVVWHGPGIDEQDVYARRFDAEASPLAPEFRLNSITTKKQRYPRVAVSQTGAFIAVWQSQDPESAEDTWIAAGRLYDANGTAVGNDFFAIQMSDCRYPHAAMDARGNFVVVWVENNSTNSIMARLYNSQARAAAEAFPISSVGFGSLTRPAVAMRNDGYFVATWDGHHQASSMDDIHARSFSSDGAPLGEQFVVNTTTEQAQENPRISMTEEGEFVIVWHSKGAVGANARDVFAQQYNHSAVPVGREIRLNSFAPDEQKYPAVAISPNARFVAAWQSLDQDGSGYGIFATSSVRVCPADFTDDGFVNFRDYCTLIDQWLTQGDADLTMDGMVDFNDMGEFCRSWLSPCQQCRMAE